MHAPAVRPILHPLHQPGAHRILLHVLPLLRIAFSIAHPMMKPACLKRPGVRMRFGKSVFPKTDPTLDRELQITRRAEEMQVVGHEQIITHEPSGGGVFPDMMQRALHGRLREPSFALVGADGEENPVRSRKRGVNAFRRRATSGVVEREIAHGRCFIEARITRNFRMGQSGSFALPPGRADLPVRRAAAPPRLPPDGQFRRRGQTGMNSSGWSRRPRSLCF